MEFIAVLADYFSRNTLTDKDKEYARKQLELFFKYADENNKLYFDVYQPPILEPS